MKKNEKINHLEQDRFKTKTRKLRQKDISKTVALFRVEGETKLQTKHSIRGYSETAGKVVHVAEGKIT